MTLRTLPSIRRAAPAAVLVALLAAAPLPAQEKPDLAQATKEWVARDGFLRLYRPAKERQKLRAAIPAELLGQPFFFATSVSGGTEYAGWQWEDKLVRFERFEDRVLLVELNSQQRASKDDPLGEVVARTYADRLLATLDVLAEGEGGELLVDLGGLLTRGYSTFFSGAFSCDASLARFVKDKAFPNNVEIAVQMPLHGDGTFVTLHYSISALPPVEDYTPRAADDRIGYFLTAIRDYSQGDPREGRMVRYVNRWKLEKADPKLAMSPPRQPIVFYVEKTVPYSFRRAVAEGILEWNRAFEALGITGAIVVRQQTETEFADIDPEDVRHNFFRWITSETPFAMGPSRVDPRTGRILDADIIFDDSMLRGYLREYDVMIREGPEKMLTAPMADHLRRHPEQHPLARTRGEDPVAARVRSVVRELAQERPAPAAPGAPADTIEALLARLGAPTAERPTSSATCQLGDMVAHRMALLDLAATQVVGDGKQPLLDDLVAQVVKETVMHEVGHTLGLRHNFAASSWVDLDAINSPGKPAEITASVMDYHPLNLSVGDEERPQGYFVPTTIGPYDRLAIEYGYRLCDEESDELRAIPRKLAELGLPYATDEDATSPDPLIARWDMGNDPLKFGAYRLRMVRRMWQNLETRAVADGESYSRLRRALDMTLFEVQQSGLFAARLVGGLRFHRDHRGDPNARPPISVVDAARQREAVQWVCREIFAPDAIKVSPELLSKVAAGRWYHWGSRDPQAPLDYPFLDRVQQVQTWILFFLTSDDLLARLWENEQRQQGDALTIPELFDALDAAIFAELPQAGPASPRPAADPVVTSMRQNLQDAYVRRLIQIALGNGVSPPVATKLAWARLEALEARLARTAVLDNLDPYTKAHLAALKAQSTQARNAQYVHIASGCALGEPRATGRSTLAGLLALAGALVLVRRRARRA